MSQRSLKHNTCRAKFAPQNCSFCIPCPTELYHYKHQTVKLEALGLSLMFPWQNHPSALCSHDLYIPDLVWSSPCYDVPHKVATWCLRLLFPGCLFCNKYFPPKYRMIMSAFCLEVLMALQYSLDKTLSVLHVINGDKCALVYFPSRGLVKNLRLTGEFGAFGNENKVLPNEGQIWY